MSNTFNEINTNIKWHNYQCLLSCYKSVAQSLQDLLLRPAFIELSERWRNRQVPQDTLADVYDGKVWQEFQNINGVSFLSLPYNNAFSINVDWFQPFKRTQHSTRVMYLVVHNLPRSEKFKHENIIIVGIIPGPHEPSKTINSHCSPLVDELNQLWVGILMQTPQNISLVVRAALICVACDIPAARKVCGFMSHNALLGCSKCLKQFPTTSFMAKNQITWDLTKLIGHHDHPNYIVTMHICTKFVTPSRQSGKWNVIMVVGTQFYWNCLILMLCVCVLLIPCIICYLGQQSICYLFGSHAKLLTEQFSDNSRQN